MQKDVQLAQLRAVLDEYNKLVRNHGHLSASEVIRREELAELLYLHTARPNRKTAVQQAVKILEDPSLYEAEKVRRRRRAMEARRQAALRQKIVESSGPRSSQGQFDADRVRSVVSSATETSRRRH